MTSIITGGIEGGASKSAIILFNESGELIASADGPATNFWIVGKDEARKRIVALINEARSKAKIPPNVKIDCMCLSMSGGEDEAVNEEFKQSLLANHSNICEKYVVCSDTVAPIAVAHEAGGAVIIAGTGSNALLINPDGTQTRCGGWGHILGDEGGAFWISQKGMKVYFDEQDGLKPTPHGYSSQVLWSTIQNYFKISDRAELLGHVYKENMKSPVAGLCKELAKQGSKGDPLCKWLFEQAGKELAKHLQSVARGAHPSLMEVKGGLPVVCVGSVWRSWSLLELGFVSQLRRHPEPSLKEASLLTLTTSVATGAAYLAAKEIEFDMPRDYTKNVSVFYHFVATSENH